jgi:hypothetical protein
MMIADGGPMLWWTRPDEEATAGVRTGDPLGLRVFVRHLGGRISPALTRSSMQVWGFGLLALGVRVAGGGVGGERRLLRWQRLLALAAVAEEPDEPVWSLGGVVRARRLLEEGQPVPLDQPLLAHERSAGLWGGYARAARMYRLLEPGKGPYGHVVSRHGQRLAAATATALGRRSDTLTQAVDDDEVDVQDLGLSFAGEPQTQADRLGSALRVADRQAGYRLAGIWPQLDHIESPRPGLLDTSELRNADQRDAVTAAASVAGLLEQVETAFRSDDATLLEPGLARHPAFEHASRAGYDLEYDPVQDALKPGGAEALENLWTVHTQRYPHTGRWARDEEPDEWDDTVPDYGLDAVLALHAQGVQL